jgi:hypothetical protein
MVPSLISLTSFKSMKDELSPTCRKVRKLSDYSLPDEKLQAQVQQHLVALGGGGTGMVPPPLPAAVVVALPPRPLCQP